ncbi:YhbY family RNA-binding protein [Halocatena pleomorpha]|uniref:YhbY family RNA-binding protein n=1 Tax=Halocatena pleomorpha TaxID=1785090 RepID=A0A3P3R6F9_9EURY|nr:YhbY family RNA-binding protein [Halocatena pleomorpha]RRJ29046.1 YhbY family RNA-binding protein [Halocatena pleomorpha]
MSDDLHERAHEIDATIRVGKRGIDSVTDELRDQLSERTLVKVKFLRSSRGGTTTDELATELALKVDAELIETRGHTAVYH